MKKLNLFLLMTFIPSTAFLAVDEEQILMRQAALEAEKVHVRNVALLGIDPKSCRPTDKPSLMITQIGQIKSGKLNHCPDYLKDKLKAIEDEIQNVKNGVLVYAPVKLPQLTAIPAEPSFPENDSPGPLEGFETPATESVTESDDFETDYTGLSAAQRRRIFIYREKNKAQYVNYEDDDLFLKLSNAYMRNLPKLMAKPDLKEEQE
jgi:hypothetical protein